MSECCACGKTIPKERAKVASGSPRKYCDMKCYIGWRNKNSGGIVQFSNVERHKDRAEIDKAMAKAREGDTMAKAWLRRNHGLTALWNPTTQTLEKCR